MALASSADVLIFGGAAGGGKTRGLLMEPLRHVKNSEFGGVIFRSSYPNIFNEGSLWDESVKIYPGLGAIPKVAPPQWTFPSGAKVQFRHLSNDRELQDWHGAQIAFIGFDELCEFSEKMFWYLFSRNRSTSGVKPYVRCTCNPPEIGDENSQWVAKLVDWWIGDDGFPIPERSGKIRWFIRLPEGIQWANSRPEAVQMALDAGIEYKVANIMPKSFTFVPSLLSDNPTLERTNPGYRANLMAQERHDRDRLLGGNWKVQQEEGELFPRGAWQRELRGNVLRVAPQGIIWARGWDKAGTEKGKGARSAGVLVGLQPSTMRWFIGHVRAGRWGDIEREREIKGVAHMDRNKRGQCTIVVEQEPGSGGKESAMDTIRMLRGFDAVIDRVKSSKPSRWRPLARQVQAGNVWLIDDGTWDVEEFVSELDALSGDETKDKSKLKDCADGASGAFNWLASIEDFSIFGDLLCSGDEEHYEEEHTPVPDHKLDELPPVLADIISELRADKRRGGGYDRDDW